MFFLCTQQTLSRNQNCSTTLKMSLSKYHAGGLRNTLTTLDDLPDSLCCLIWYVHLSKFFPATCKRFRDLVYETFSPRYLKLELPEEILHVHGGCVPPNVIIDLDVYDNESLEALCSFLCQTKGSEFIKGLRCHSTEVSDISSLSSCTCLRFLDLQTQVSDISPLSSCTYLHTLGLQNTQVSDISPLSSCTGLQVLGLQNTQVSDISPLSSCTGLQVLGLESINVLVDISPLSSCTGLQFLDLHNTQVSDISPLSRCTGLQSLYLGFTDVSDISSLSSCTGLQTLDLKKRPLQYQTLSSFHLSSCTTLQYLNLTNTQVSDISSLSRCTGLQTLDLSHTNVSNIWSSIFAFHVLPWSSNFGFEKTQVSDISQSPDALVFKLWIWYIPRYHHSSDALVFNIYTLLQKYHLNVKYISVIRVSHKREIDFQIQK